MDHRLPGASQALRLFPRQAATLAMFGRLGFSEGKMAAAIGRLASASPAASGEWDGFLKAAAGPAPMGIPKPPRVIPKPPVVPAAPPKPALPAAPPAPLGTPTVPPKGAPIQGYSPAQAEKARLSSMAVRNLREGGQHDADPVNQFLGTTTHAVRAGQGNPQAPLAPAQDLSLGQGLGRAAMAGPRAMAGAVAVPFAAAADAERAARRPSLGGNTSFANTRGAVVDATSPLFAGLGINPLGNNGEKSLFGELMPGYARSAIQSAADPANSPMQRAGYRTLASGAQNAELAAGVTGSFGMRGLGGLASRFPRMAQGANLTRALTGPAAVGFAGAQNLGEEGKAGPTQGVSLGHYNAAAIAADYAALPPQAVPPGRGDNPAMQPESVRTAQPQAPASPPPATPQQAQANLQQAHKSIEDLHGAVQSGRITPQQAHAEFASHADSFITNQAALTGQDPAKLKAAGAAYLQSGGKDPAALAQLHAAAQASPAMQQQPGLVEQFKQLPVSQQIGLGLGLPMALLGIGQSLFGEGGMGSMLMALLGIGGAAHGLGMLSGQGPLGGLGNQLGMGHVRTLFGMPEPAPGAAGQGGATPPAPAGGVSTHPPQAAAPGNFRIPQSFWGRPRDQQKATLDDILAGTGQADAFDQGASAYALGSGIKNNVPFGLGGHALSLAGQPDPDAALAERGAQFGATPEQARQLFDIRAGR